MIEAGVQFPYFKAKSVTKDEISSSPVTHAKAGLIYSISLKKNLSIQPGIFFSGKGGKIFEKDRTGTLTDRIYINYFEFPLNLNYTIKHFKGHSLFIGGGPYLARAVGGKEKLEITLNNSKPVQSVRELNIGTHDGVDIIRPWDLGVNVSAGLHLRWGVYVRLNYGLGLLNIYPTSKPKDFSLMQRAFAICLGYGMAN